VDQGDKDIELTRTAIVRKWRRWIERLESEVQGLLIACHIFEGVREIVARNPQIHGPDDFFSWLARNYATSVSLGIRKLTDHDNRSLSLKRFLEDVAANASVLTRDGYVAMYRSQKRDLAHRHFTALVGGAHKTVPLRLIRSDIRKMEQAERRIRALVNKRLAHLELKTRRRRLPTYGELSRTVQMLESVLLKYRRLISAHATTTLLPTWQYNWQEVFLVPWITNPNENESSDAD
jgi:hypothetical protein